ncbi:MAG: aminodeoxychorismate synthase, component I, partial [Dehalococcoidia bacterium]
MQSPPFVEEITSLLNARQAFEFFKDRPYSFFLDSGMDPGRLGRYSFMGSDPFLIMSSRGGEIILLGPEDENVISGNPFDVLGELLAKYRIESNPTALPFTGGAVGYLGYDLGRFIEKLPS